MSELKFTIHTFSDKTVLKIFDDKVHFRSDGLLGGATIRNAITGSIIREEKELELYFCDINAYGFKNCGWTSGFFEFGYFDPLSKMNLQAKIILGRSTIGNAKKIALEAEPIDKYISITLNEFNRARSVAIKESSKDNIESPNYSIADELNKLNDLLQKGAINQDEFSALKSKIISK